MKRQSDNSRHHLKRGMGNELSTWRKEKRQTWKKLRKIVARNTEELGQMNQGFIDILQKLVSEQGKEALLNPSKCKAFLADYTHGEYKKESRLLLQALEAGVQKAIDTTDELEICKKQQARVLREEHFVAAEAATNIVDTLALVFRGELKSRTSRGDICSNCGKELQKEWRVCPFCGTSAKIQQPKPQSLPKPIVQTSSLTSPAKTAVPVNMVRVEGGTFQMGSDTIFSNERPLHTVTVKSFYMGKYQVTQKEWQDVIGNNPSSFKGDNLPVESVSWRDAVEYCNKLSIKKGFTPAYSGSVNNITWNRNANGYRLPTEAEWEYAAKGGNGSPGNYTYSGSNTIGDVAWYCENSEGRTHPVGIKSPNSLGIYDMSGNVWEWCWDWYGRYSVEAETDPGGAAIGSYRVIRGGYWGSVGYDLRSAVRYSTYPNAFDSGIGFRLVRP